ncbi:MAG: metal-binding protein [Deltaproteobacteria bacterium]|nr:MAG: metal-binding protein [Deltaproteobacteria bacterium]
MERRRTRKHRNAVKGRAPKGRGNSQGKGRGAQPKRRKKSPPFAEKWWARRWIEVIESFGWKNRLQRGRDYALQGHVIEMNISPGTVSALVQGRQRLPYEVRIHVKVLSNRKWEKVTRFMASQAMFSAKLLVGEMPEKIEEAFEATGMSLFPRKKQQIRFTCSCPDWASHRLICKHIAAVCYLLGTTFDRDPFLLFKLRGREKSALIESLRRHRSLAPQGGKSSLPAPSPEEEELTDLFRKRTRFWQLNAPLEDFQITIAPPAVSYGVLKRLGLPPAATPEFLECLMEAYTSISQSAIEMAFAEAPRAGENHRNGKRNGTGRRRNSRN